MYVTDYNAGLYVLQYEPDPPDGARLDPIWLQPPPGLVAAAAALPRPAPAGDPAARLAALLAGGAAGAYAWALDGPSAGRRVWGEQAVLGLALPKPGWSTLAPTGTGFTLASQVSNLAQWAWLAGDPAGGRQADLVACELAIGGWPTATRWTVPTWSCCATRPAGTPSTTPAQDPAAHHPRLPGGRP